MPDQATSVVSVAVVGEMERPQPVVFEPAGRVQRLQRNEPYNGRTVPSERETVSPCRTNAEVQFIGRRNRAISPRQIILHTDVMV